MKKKIALVIVLVLVLVASFTFIVRGRDQGGAPSSISNTEDTETVKLAYEPEPTPETTPVLTPEPMPENTPEPTPEPTTEPIEWFEEVDEAVWTLNKTTPYSTFDEDAIEIKDEGEAIKKGVQLNRTGKGTKELEQWSRCVDADGNTVYILTIDLSTTKPVVYTGGGTGNGGNGNTPPPVQQQPSSGAIPPSDWESGGTGGRVTVDPSTSGSVGGDYSGFIIA